MNQPFVVNCCKETTTKGHQEEKRLAYLDLLGPRNTSNGPVEICPDLTFLVPTAVSVRRRGDDRIFFACLVPTVKHGGGGVGLLCW